MTDILKRIDRLRSRLNNIACELETLQQIVAAGGLKSKKTVTKNKQKTVMTDFDEQLQLPLEGNVPNTLTNNDNNDMDEQKSVMTVFKKEKSLIKKERNERRRRRIDIARARERFFFLFLPNKQPLPRPLPC